MRLNGSCHCGKVRFALDTHTPQPFMRCYCTVCRKTAGGGGYAINIMGEAATLKVTGRRQVTCYRALAEQIEGGGDRSGRSQMRRYFCRHCGSALWGADPRWAQWVYPFASAIDTPLPKPAEVVHLMLDFAAPWVEVPRGPRHRRFQRYPEEAIIDWHKRRGLTVP